MQKNFQFSFFLFGYRPQYPQNYVGQKRTACLSSSGKKKAHKKVRKMNLSNRKICCSRWRQQTRSTWSVHMHIDPFTQSNSHASPWQELGWLGPGTAMARTYPVEKVSIQIIRGKIWISQILHGWLYSFFFFSFWASQTIGLKGCMLGRIRRDECCLTLHFGCHLFLTGNHSKKSLNGVNTQRNFLICFARIEKKKNCSFPSNAEDQKSRHAVKLKKHEAVEREWRMAGTHAPRGSALPARASWARPGSGGGPVCPPRPLLQRRRRRRPASPSEERRGWVRSGAGTGGGSVSGLGRRASGGRGRGTVTECGWPDQKGSAFFLG